MSLQKIITYLNTKIKDDTITIGEGYGNENFCYLIYSLIRMEHPQTVIELGSGLGSTTCMMAQALKENGKGTLWAIDNGQDWKTLKKHVGKPNQSYENFFQKLLERFELEKFVKFKNITLTPISFFNPQKPVDMMFFDAHDSSAQGCTQLLRYYLPIMNKYSSIFIDRSSTINHAYLMLEQLVQYLQQGKIPACLVSNRPQEEVNAIYQLVLNSKFTLIHLAETEAGKKNKAQNSTAWIKIEPLDILIHNQVENQF